MFATTLRCYALAAAMVVAGPLPGLAHGSDFAAERKLYQAAQADLKHGRSAAFAAKRRQLSGYPLRAYLDYREIRRRLSRTQPGEILDFRSTWAGSEVGERLYSEWLMSLRRRGDWNNLAHYYEPQQDPQMQCAYARALYRSGDHEAAFREVPKLWLIGTSQHQECDPVFEVWTGQHRHTQEQVWRRIELAYAANRRGLAHYLFRFLDVSERGATQEFDRVHLRPSRIGTQGRYQKDDVATRRIVGHGIARMARSNPEQAASLWRQYQKTLNFGEELRKHIEGKLLLELARTDKTGLLVQAHELPLGEDDRLFREVTLSLLRQRAWAAAFERLASVTPGVMDEAARRYWLWLAASRQPFLSAEDQLIADQAANELAKSRSYYGFLLAHQLGLAPNFRHQPIVLGQAGMERLSELPSAMIVLELFALGEVSSARRELAYVAKKLEPEDARLLIKRVSELGWMSEAMMVAPRGGAADDLELRFPLAFEHLYRQAATRTGLPLPLLLGLSRQESLFRMDARSSAGARGLMQLMPATARSVARRMGRSPVAATDLYRPTLNIELGSYYLAEILGKMGGNRALAAASYNAGQGNLNRWRKAYGGQPIDLFIESIRFRETREYVKSVLAFTAVYAWKLGLDPPFLNQAEMKFGAGLHPARNIHPARADDRTAG
ncbi:MAG: transglycosylase SLT domain-containing protein [Halieaceae bacterium]|nr:transglycosylase SLT domain-containing protein [Halieaceae bacterium]